MTRTTKPSTKFVVPAWVVAALGGDAATIRIANEYKREIRAAGIGPQQGIKALLLALESEADARLS
jgi:hypothetical protein